MVLVGGDPGIGKSTLLLQMCGRIEKQASVLYITGEESASQVALRAERQGGQAAHLWMLAETRIEAILAGATHFSMPQRVATGFDARRMTILLALLERHSGMHLGGYDVFLSVAGGLNLDDPGGELGLGGEIRPPAQLEARLKEARQMGFKRALVGRTPKPVKVESLEIVVCEDLGVALGRGLG